MTLSSKSKCKPSFLPQNFSPDLHNRIYAEKWKLKLDCEVADFANLHWAVGNVRRNWHKAFQQHLRQSVERLGLEVRPSWVPREVWVRYAEMRGRKRRGLVRRGFELLVQRLEELRRQGRDPVAALEQSIARGWSSVWPAKRPGNCNVDLVEATRRERAGRNPYA